MYNPSYPLSGLTVIELGTHVAVPVCCRAFADLGATVIKVESITGDDWRNIGSSFRIPIEDEENAMFLLENSNKELISLNLKSEEGKAILKQLLSQADIFISNVRYQSLQKMGLSYEDIKDDMPKLIYCHFTGYGNKGALSSRPGFDSAAFWARNGANRDWVPQDAFPIKAAPGFGDTASSLMIFSAAMSALYARDHHGKGGFVTTSLLGNGIWCNAGAVVVAQAGYDCRFPESETCPPSPFGHYYKCKDGEWMLIMVLDGFRGSLPKMIRLFDLAHFFDDETFVSQLQANPEPCITALTAAIKEKFLTYTSEEWAQRFDEADIVYEKAAHIQDVPKDQQAWDNDYLETISFPSGMNAVIPRYPVSFSAYDTKPIKNTGAVGRDTATVLKRLGYRETEIEAMAKEKAIRK